MKLEEMLKNEKEMILGSEFKIFAQDKDGDIYGYSDKPTYSSDTGSWGLENGRCRRMTNIKLSADYNESVLQLG